jgi:hypothetical protein
MVEIEDCAQVPAVDAFDDFAQLVQRAQQVVRVVAQIVGLDQQRDVERLAPAPPPP